MQTNAGDKFSRNTKYDDADVHMFSVCLSHSSAEDDVCVCVLFHHQAKSELIVNFLYFV